MLSGDMCQLCGSKRTALPVDGMKKNVPVYVCLKCDVHPKLGPQHLLRSGDQDDVQEEL